VYLAVDLVLRVQLSKDLFLRGPLHLHHTLPDFLFRSSADRFLECCLAI
jgi:hypothetical protein